MLTCFICYTWSIKPTKYDRLYLTLIYLPFMSTVSKNDKIQEFHFTKKHVVLHVTMRFYFPPSPKTCTYKSEVKIEYIFKCIFFCLSIKAQLFDWTRGMGGWSSFRVASWATDWQSRDTYQRRNQWWGQKFPSWIKNVTRILQWKWIFLVLFFQVSAAGGALHCCLFRPPGSGRLAAWEWDACWGTSRSPSVPPVVSPNRPPRHRKVSHPHSCRVQSAPHPQTLHCQETFGLGLSGPCRSWPFESCSSSWSQGLCALLS